MESSDRAFLEYLLSNILLNFRENNVIKNYFKFVFADLASRNFEESEIKPKISKIVFLKYFNLPVVVSERIFKIFDGENKGYLTEFEFYDSMMISFSFSADKLIKFVFDIFDYDCDGKINKEDVIMVVNFLNSEVKLVKSINSITDFIFASSEENLDFSHFAKLIEEEDSSLFLLILIFLSKASPFSEESFLYLQEKISVPLDINNKEEFKNEKQIALPNDEILQLINFTKNNSQKNNESIEEEENDRDYSILHSSDTNQSSVSERKQLKHNYFQLKVVTEIISYKLSSKNKLVKYKLVLLENEVFSFKVLKNNQLLLTNIHPLSGLFFSTYEQVSNSGKTLYTFALLNKYGGFEVGLENIYICKSKFERNELVFQLKLKLNQCDFSELYEVTGEIGKGHFGRVVVAFHRETQTKVAVKIIKKIQLTQQKEELVYREIDILKFLKSYEHNTNFVNLIEICEDDHQIYLVMEYITGGTLKSLTCLRESKLKVVFYQIADGIRTLHGIGVIHRDIKPENILLSIKGQKINAKIIDFGFCKILGKNEKTQESLGTLLFSAPEVIIGNVYDHRVDVWSFAVLLYNISTGKLPFDTKNASVKDIGDIIDKTLLSIPINVPLSKELIQLIIECLQKHPSQRKEMKEIIKLDWFI